MRSSSGPKQTRSSSTHRPRPSIGQRRGSLVHTDCEGRDLAEPEGVRIYHWTGTQHSADPNQQVPRRAVCRNWLNVAQTSMLFRAALDALDRWAGGGPPPPPSRYPRVADGTLVPYETWSQQFPAIPGGAVPQSPNSMPALDFGPRAGEGILDREPPEVIAEEGYPVLVPAVDRDGNEIAGVRAPMIAAPVGTFAGWNLRRRGVAGGAMHEFSGSYIPFPDTPEERAATGDPPPFPAGTLRGCGRLCAGHRGGGAKAGRGRLHAGGGTCRAPSPARRIGPAR